MGFRGSSAQAGGGVGVLEVPLRWGWKPGDIEKVK